MVFIKDKAKGTVTQGVRINRSKGSIPGGTTFKNDVILEFQ